MSRSDSPYFTEQTRIDLDRRISRDFEREPALYRKQRRIALTGQGTARALVAERMGVDVESLWRPSDRSAP